MINNICYKHFVHPFFFFVSSLIVLLVLFTTTSAIVTSKLSDKCIDKERDALLHFKSYIHHDPKGLLSTWMTEGEEATNDCCQWVGVECNKHARVVSIYLSEGDLVGKLSPSLLSLSYLNDLELSENYFHGFIPTFINGSMTRLKHLDLSYNSFHGSIPKFIGSMTRLKHLDLGDNNFTGTIPPVLGNLTNLEELSLGNLKRCTVENLDWLSQLSHIESLDMYGISLASVDNWVNMILSFKNLSYLNFGECGLSQVMHPYSYPSFNSSSSIVVLFLENNNLNTSMYHWLFPLTSNALELLFLSANNLDWIPKYLGNLCSLKFLYFNDNLMPLKLSDLLNNLSGCTSHTLKFLYASSSRLIGSLSDDIHKFSSLSILDLSNNQLDWTISEKVWKLPELRLLDVSNNSLEQVPSEAQMPNISSVENINWSSCKLGPHFPKWIQALKNLSSINLAHNKVSDAIPEEFWSMWPSQLRYLNLSSNNITGIITNLSSNFDDPGLQFTLIDLSSNNFYGPIPGVPFNLIALDLSRNKFSGEISFLCQIYDGFITLINLSHNSFTGQIPDCLYHFTTLEFLNLGHNSFSGRVPASIQHLINLKVLNLYNNSLSGELTSSLQNCTDLKFLELGANNFSGYVPVWIGEKLSRLHALSLTSNKLFGTIPIQLCELVHLRILDLSMNNLNGTIPTCLSNLMSMNNLNGTMSNYSLEPYVHNFELPLLFPSIFPLVDYVDHAMIKWQGHLHEFSKTLGLLTIIDLSRNNLTGKIPQELTNLSKLIALDLSMNALHGEIPLNIGEMKELQILDLSRNNLSGVIPSSMSKISFLNYLDVSYNNLSGKIPSGTQLQTFDPSMYIGNERLCGLPLSKHCPGDKEKEATLAIGEGETEDDIQMWFYIGGAIGFSIGFWMVCIALLVYRRGRHTFFHFLDHLENWVYVKVMILIAKSQRVASP
ncbi:hypothetical protein QVD17_01016 [Tagetes erecta]|uniref:Leucine-rich repeat-containing N-terminal plant-type domain-containing protein n=1 Tax=Tagetes erecta TaxID=13708 RepID=A0AAD8P137_TARER|nr:hypothetical protein QVD17_01016 [Tagetes erecta]